jgi:hypothetical protein
MPKKTVAFDPMFADPATMRSKLDLVSARRTDAVSIVPGRIGTIPDVIRRTSR